MQVNTEQELMWFLQGKGLSGIGHQKDSAFSVFLEFLVATYMCASLVRGINTNKGRENFSEQPLKEEEVFYRWRHVAKASQDGGEARRKGMGHKHKGVRNVASSQCALCKFIVYKAHFTHPSPHVRHCL